MHQKTSHFNSSQLQARSLKTKLSRLFKQATTLLVLASLQLGTLVQTQEAYAQYASYASQPTTGQLSTQPNTQPNIYPPALNGYSPDGTLFMGGQRIGNPHQVLHDAQIPAFMTLTGFRATYSNVNDPLAPNYGQGTLAQMQTQATTGSDASVLFNRVYLTPNNPYPVVPLGTHNNYQTYQNALKDAKTANYLLTHADDGKTYAFKTLTAASQQAADLLIRELPNTSQFKAYADPNGGAVLMRVSQNGDAVALSAYLKTIKPYDYSWQPNFGTNFGQNGNNGSNGNNGNNANYSGWANANNFAPTYEEGGSAQRTGDAARLALIKQLQDDAIKNDKRVRSQTSANSLDLSGVNPNSLFGEGYNLFQYASNSNPNRELENDFLRRLQAGQLTPGSSDYLEASRIAQERYRIAYATRLETGKPLQYSIEAAQAKANELKLGELNPNKLFGDGYDLFKYDPNDTHGEADNALLLRLQNGQLTPGTPEYAQASQIAQQRYRYAYSLSLAFNTAPHFSLAEAQRKANEIDLTGVNPNDLFGQGFDLFQYNPELHPNGEAENALLSQLQNGELTAGSDAYKQATQIAQDRLRQAYSVSMLPPPEPKKVAKWKLIAAVVVGAVLTFVTAGALAPLLAGAVTAMTGAAVVAGTVVSSVVSAAASIIASAVGAIASTTITTGSFSEGLKAGGKALVSGSVTAIVSAAIGIGFDFAGLSGLEGVSGTVSNMTMNTISGAVSSTILGGGSFADNLKTAAISSVVNAVAKEVANGIGDAFPNKDGTNVANYAAHAVLGCASAAAKGGDCAAGAIGAAAGEAAAATGFLDAAAKSTIGRTLNKDEVVFFGGLVGGTAAAVASKAEDVNANFATGTATATNAVTNNYLNHNQIKEKEARLASVKDETDRQTIRDEYEQLDINQRDNAAACLLRGKCESVFDKENLRATLNELVASCVAPRICSADQRNGINELQEMYLTRQAIKPDTTIEELALMFGKVPKALLSVAESVWTRETIAAVRVDASSSLQGARLNMQLSAEQAAGSQAPTVISSYSEHAISRMTTRDGGVGVNQTAVADAFKNPLKIEYYPTQYGPTFRYIGKDATVNVNPQGNVTTVWARNSGGYK
jgi:Possible hemagglutinin (DUF637)/Pre-toxin domain with VENN motif